MYDKRLPRGEASLFHLRLEKIYFTWYLKGIFLMIFLGNLCERSLLRSPSLQHTLLHLAMYKRGILLIYLLPLFDINQIIAINREILLLS